MTEETKVNNLVTLDALVDKKTAEGGDGFRQPSKPSRAEVWNKAANAVDELTTKVATLEQVLHSVLIGMNKMREEGADFQNRVRTLMDALTIRVVGLTRELISLGGLDETSLNKAFVEAAAEMLESRQNEIDRSMKIITVDREAKEGDTVLVDYSGSVDGKVFEGGTAHRQLIKIGAGGFIDDFDKKLAGIKATETREIEVTFPVGYQAKELAGKPAKFKIICHAVKTPTEGDGTATEVVIPPVDGVVPDAPPVDSGEAGC